MLTLQRYNYNNVGIIIFHDISNTDGLFSA